MFIKLNDIKKSKNRIEYDYTCDAEMQKYMQNEKFYIEYLTDIDFSDVPDSICSIPFVTNFLPFSWFFGATIEIDTIDKNFYDCLPNLENGVKKIYSTIEVGTNIKIHGNIECNDYAVSEKTVCLFSGG